MCCAHKMGDHMSCCLGNSITLLLLILAPLYVYYYILYRFDMSTITDKKQVTQSVTCFFDVIILSYALILSVFEISHILSASNVFLLDISDVLIHVLYTSGGPNNEHFSFALVIRVYKRLRLSIIFGVSLPMAISTDLYSSP